MRYLDTLVETISTLLINLQKPKTCQKKSAAATAIWSVIRILTVFFYILIANMNGGSDSYKACHFLRDCNKNFQIHICKLL